MQFCPHPSKWMKDIYPDGCLVSAVVATLEQDEPLTARYQAFRKDFRLDDENLHHHLPLCPPCTLDKAYAKAEQVLLGNGVALKDPRTLYALAAVLIGLLDHNKEGGLFHMPVAGDAP